ncbi:hypothetical protein BU16DRAFT_2253 [Lophium mytilinum]|uniref:Uncharacterized protein n=1 Tax=Lophium mytilinum TaxID=390894 RepID=A0A6A6RBR4_9PEZI|nr:hypothetical protein BU16DRAFT_2253 [Lophium mytilinum]
MHNNTLNSTRVGWVSSPEGRGTAELLYSCLFTIFLCTWTAYHPEIPPPYWSSWTNFRYRFWLTVMILLFPESVVLIAAADSVATKRLIQRIHALSPQISGDVEEGNLPPLERHLSLQERNTRILQSVYTNRVHAHFVCMEGMTIKLEGGQIHQLNVALFMDLAQAGLVEVPEFSRGDRADWSKADSFAKTITLLQLTWFLATTIGRASQHLPISTLEIFTLTNIGCTVIASLSWWDKPKDITRSLVLTVPGEQDEVDAVRAKVEDDIRREDNLILSGKLVVVSSFILIGAVSFLAWSFSFFTTTELYCWRVLSCVATAISIVLLLLVLMNPKENMFATSLFLGYCFLRAFFAIEAFVALRSVPAGVYVSVSWSQYFPHI